MGITSRIETWLGATRADATVALVLASIAIVGFIYTTFFSERPGPLEEQRALFELVRTHDSLIESMRNARFEDLERTLDRTSINKQVAANAVDVDRDDGNSLMDSVSVEEEQRRAQAYDQVETLNDRPSSSRSSREPSGPININTAPKSRLMDLPGVGEKTADKIIERRRITPFKRPEDIMEVKGIGEKKFQKMKRWILVR